MNYFVNNKIKCIPVILAPISTEHKISIKTG